MRLWPVVLLAAAVQLWLGGRDPWWSDWGTEALPSVEALLRGHVGDFLSLAPTYGASIELRAPFLLIADALGGGEQMLYRAGALPAVLAVGALTVALLRDWSSSWSLPALLVVGLSIGSPVLAEALKTGHPEDLAAAALSVLAVLAATRSRPVATGLLLGLAIACKQWAVVAVMPAVVALPHGRVMAVGLCGTVAAALWAPFLLGQDDFSGAQAGAAGAGAIFRSQQWWWPVGEAALTDDFGPRVAPAWLTPFTKPLIVAASLPLALLWARFGRRRRVEDALLLLALLFLLRCTLDPWNIGYYHLPLVLSLLAWETRVADRLPVLTLAVTGLTLASFSMLGQRYGDLTFVFYAAWTVPLGAFMLWRLVRPEPVAAPGRFGPAFGARSAPSGA